MRSPIRAIALFILETAVGHAKCHSPFDKLRANGVLRSHPAGEIAVRPEQPAQWVAGSRWAGRINWLFTRLAGTLLVAYALYLATEIVGWI